MRKVDACHVSNRIGSEPLEIFVEIPRRMVVHVGLNDSP
jgi:hypothetical protein